MSDLEISAQPIIGALMADISITLDEEQRKNISIWALKTAMVSEAIKAQTITRSYQRSDCENLRLRSEIPAMTRVWLGRFSGTGLAVQGTDIWPNPGVGPKDSQGTVTTILIGHLTIQVLTVYIPEENRPEKMSIGCDGLGPWEQLLVDIWPANGMISWPPPLSFTNDGGPLSLFRLQGRWQIGQEVGLKSIVVSNN